jgi:geranylgeranyl diphosphate synthase type II
MSNLSRRRTKVTSEERSALEAYLKARKEIVDEALGRYLPAEGTFPPVIFQSIRYSVFAGGKRIRPILCIAAAEAVGGILELVIPAACALELIHTYSLIHDDLPAMDDDEYRRGKLTNHRVFGEDIAILAGDALLTEAFHLLSGNDLADRVPAATILTVINEVSEAAGYFGMVGGQVLDVEAEGKTVDLTALNNIHSRKTGAMIRVAVRGGALLAGADERRLQALSEYGSSLGIAFQIADDILDVEGDRELLGKKTGADIVRRKATFPALVGLRASKKKARELVDRALKAIAAFDGKADPLRWIAEFVVERKV